MKMNISHLLTTAATVAFFATNLVSAFPIFNLNMKRVDFHFVQDCLYLGPEATKDVELCKSLHHPTFKNSNTTALKPLIRSMRNVFYYEATILWKLMLEWSACHMNTGRTSPKECLESADYAGIFLPDHRKDKYSLVDRFLHRWYTANAFADKLKHCMTFHHDQSEDEGETGTAHFELFPSYEEVCSSYSLLTLDNLADFYPTASKHFFKNWEYVLFAQHGFNFPLRTSTERTELRAEKQIFDCLYRPESSAHNQSQRTFCRSIVTEAATKVAANSFSTGKVVRQGLDRTQQHYSEFVRANIAYDCLKYHRHQHEGEAPWCKGVAQMVSCTWRKTSLHHDPVIRDVLVYLMKEEVNEWIQWSEAARHNSFLMLPKHLATLCQLHNIFGIKNANRPVDCDKGGLYYDLLNV